MIDKGPPGGILRQATFAPATQFCGAGLFVDDDTDALDLLQGKPATPGAASLYDQHGNSTGSTVTHSLTRA